MRLSPSMFALLLLAGVTNTAKAVTLGHGDTFAVQGDTLAWTGGSGAPTPILPVQISDGGPDGLGDGYLQIGADAFHLAAKNQTQWTGDYLSAGVTALAVDFNHLNPSGDNVQLRILIDGPGGLWASSNLTPPLAGNTWQEHIFALTRADLVHVTGGTGLLSDTLADVTRLQIKHDRTSPTSPGVNPPRITATLGIDNVYALPEPATIALLALGAILLVISRSGRQQTG